MKIEVEIEYHEVIPDEKHRYLATIKEGDYKNTVVAAGSVAECFSELSKSIFVLDDFKKRFGK